MFKRSLLLRSYNSVSLPENRKYVLTLSDCHGFARPAWSPLGSHTTMSASLSTLGGIDDDLALEEDAWQPAGSDDSGSDSMEAVRLSFLSFPLSIEFGAENGKVGAILRDADCPESGPSTPGTEKLVIRAEGCASSGQYEITIEKDVRIVVA